MIHQIKAVTVYYNLFLFMFADIDKIFNLKGN